MYLNPRLKYYLPTKISPRVFYYFKLTAKPLRDPPYSFSLRQDLTEMLILLPLPHGSEMKSVHHIWFMWNFVHVRKVLFQLIYIPSPQSLILINDS